MRTSKAVGNMILKCIKEATNSICFIFFSFKKTPDENKLSVESFKRRKIKVLKKIKTKSITFKELSTYQPRFVCILFTIRFVKL